MEVHYRILKAVRNEWKELYKYTPEVSPFFKYENIEIAWKYFYPYYITERCRPTIAQFIDDGTTVALIPLTISKGNARLFGAPNGFNESGLLFKDASYLTECIELLHQGFKSIELVKIDERSPLAELRPSNCFSKTNVAIHFGDDYDLYFKSLSSSVRQNIRTSYNRLTKDTHTFETQVFISVEDNTLPINEIINLYCARHEQRYGVKTSRFKKWFLKHQNFATLFYLKSPNAITIYLTIDNIPAAFLSGLWEGNRLIVPRLSINEQYKRYSPGMILVCESIKYLMANTSIRILDLSQGEEQYKFNLGGKIHYSYNFKI